MSDYTGSSITVLEGLRSVRQTMGMYVGGKDSQAWHHCLWETVDNSVDESMAGHCDRIEVTLNPDNSVTVTDNGRGIPVDMHESGMATVEVVFCNLHAGGKFDSESYAVSGGLHGVGVAVVNALSRWVKVEIKRDGNVHNTEFGMKMGKTRSGRHEMQYGVVTSPTKAGKKIPKSETGTSITFLLDADAFTESEWDRDMILQRLRDTAVLHPALTIEFSDLRDVDDTPYHETIHRPEGLVGMLQERGAERLAKAVEAAQGRRAKSKSKTAAQTDPTTVLDQDSPISLSGEFPDRPGQTWQVMIQWYPDTKTDVTSFANSIRTVDGGTHVDGVLATLARTLNSWAKQDHIDALGKNTSLDAGDVRSGLGAIVSVNVGDPMFEGQTKGRFATKWVRSVIASSVGAELSMWLDSNPGSALEVIKACLRAKKARAAVAKVTAEAMDQDVIEKMDRKTAQAIVSKVTDLDHPSCYGKPGTELLLVEGDSAKTPLAESIDTSRQSILPLRGMIVNAEKASMDRVLANQEVQMILMALGAGYGKNFDLSKMRYEKVVILTDADAHGFYIQVLLMGLFWRLMPEMVQDGRLQAVVMPLYGRKEKGGVSRYLYSEDERKVAEMETPGLDWNRFKGLGEMNPDELAATAVLPSRRIEVFEADDPDEVNEMVRRMLGADPESRRAFAQRVQITQDMMVG